MSTRHATTPHAVALKALRVFRVTFYCDECPNEFTDEMLTLAPSYCPCCDKECEPDGYDEYEVETDEEDA